MSNFLNRVLFLVLSLGCFPMVGYTQITIAFQGGETGDNWNYTSTGADATAQFESTQAPNIISGQNSIVVGGNTPGGSCIDGGSGSGTSYNRTFTFGQVDISTSNQYTRTLTFHWGNRFPACVGTGWDSNEDLIFTPILDGVNQPSQTLAVGNNNATFSIQNNLFSYDIPACVNTFSFVIYVSTNRRDELLFLDDVRLSTPQLNAIPTIDALISGETQLCVGESSVYQITSENDVYYTWSGLPPNAQFLNPNGLEASSTMGIDWSNTPAGTYTVSVTPEYIGCGTPITGDEFDFMVTISEPSSQNIAIAICEGESYTVGGNAYTTAGNYTINLNNTAGCDSTIILTLTVLNNSESTINVTLCNGDIYSLNGTNYSTSGQFMQTLQAMNGCDSVITLNLTLLESYNVINPQAICVGESFNFHGSNYSTSGTYSATFVSENGCDSTVAIELSVNPTYSESSSILLCGDEVYEFEGVIYNTAGNFPVYLISTFGCDSTVTLQITIEDQITNYLEATICDGEVYEIDGEIYQTTGLYEIVYENALGCDSILYFNLIVLDSPDASFSYSIVNITEDGVEIDFFDNSEGATSNSWNFGNGNLLENSSTSTQTYDNTEATNYQTTLIVSNDYGCEDTVIRIISVVPELNVYVPNTFTPNGGKFNTVFLPIITGDINPQIFNMKIFNRWGEIIFETNNVKKGWDGLHNGTPAVEGTYIWVIEFTQLSNKIPVVYKGHINLLR